MPILDFLSGGTVDLPSLSTFLDGLDATARVKEIRSLTAHQLAKLFEAAAGFRAVQLADLVPAHLPPLQEVVHDGKNSLPIFSIFEKRFCLPQGQAGQLWGYNEHPLKPLVGPGYFTVYPIDEGGLMIDYSMIPPNKAASWPTIVPNSTRLGRYVYEGLEDILRGVSQHVTIGRAMRQGKYVDNWFVLCHADPA